MSFARAELTGPALPIDACDRVLCRNVLIYLTPDTKRLVLDQLARALRPGGHLVLGQAESIPASLGFTVVEPSARIYRKEAA